MDPQAKHELILAPPATSLSTQEAASYKTQKPRGSLSIDKYVELASAA